MRDIDVRKSLKAALAEEHRNDDSLIVDELQVCSHSARVDVAVINGELGGFEIKSERDTLGRLGNQERNYNLVFDRVTIVSSEKHLAKIESLVPQWWGIIEAKGSIDVALSVCRSASANPAVCPKSVAGLLWRDELLSALEKHEIDRGVRSKPRAAMIERLVSCLDDSEVRRIVRESMKSRVNWRT